MTETPFRLITFTCHDEERTGNDEMLLDDIIGGIYKTTVPTGVRERLDSITEEEFENEKDIRNRASPMKIEGAD